MPPRAVNALERLAPDQRAAVELVLRGRGYGELAGLLGIPEETVRERARGGLEALAPDLPPPARAGEVADWLLGQSSGEGARELLAADAGTRRWAQTVAAALGEVPGATTPELPSPRAPAAAPPAAPSPGRSSRRGGAILIAVAVAVLVVGGVLAYVLTSGGGSPQPVAAAPTATASGTPQASTNDIVLRGPAGSKAVGLMRLFRANDDTVRFALAAQDVAPNTGKATYSIWFRKKSGAALRLGVAQGQVGKDRTLTTAGPRNEDVGRFPGWFASYDSILVTRDSSPTAKHPGTVILSGELPHASG
jgi:hypothetical protein